MPTLPEEIDAASWSRMFHAYQVATDTPGHLKALMTDDAEAHRAAVTHLFSAQIHQGTPWPSTPTTAAFVARMLAEGLIRDPDLRASLLRFLRAVAEAGDLGDQAEESRAAAYPEDDRAINDWLERYLAADDGSAEELWSDEDQMETADLVVLRAAVDCHDAMPVLLDLIFPLTRAPEPHVRIAALSAASILARHPQAATHRSRLIEAMTESARDPDVAVDDRAAFVMCIGELGGAPREFLADPWLVVRGCAALAPALATDSDALDVLADLITSPRAFDLGFTRRPDQFTGWPRFQLIGAACARLVDEDRLSPGINAIVPADGWFLAESEIEPYLDRFFAAGRPALAERTRGQRSLARLIARSDGLWKPTDGNRGAAFARLNLPNDRDAWWELAEAPTRPGRYGRKDIEVFTGAQAVQMRPQMYFGKAVTDPGLPDHLVDLLDRAYQKAVDEGLVQAFAISTASDANVAQPPGLAFTLRVTGHELSVDPGESGFPATLTHALSGGLHMKSPLDQLGMTAAMCAKATATVHHAGQAFTQHFATATPLGPIIPADPQTGAPPDGYVIEFEIDPIRLPADARLTPRDLHRGPA